MSNSILHPHYGCAIGAAYTVAAIPKAVPIANSGPGCVDNQYCMLASGNGFQGAGFAGGGAMPSANLGEKEIVFGGIPRLDLLVKSTLKIIDGDLFVILSGCSSELIGDDIVALAKEYQEKGKPVVAVEAAGFKGNNLVGHELALEAIIDQYVGDYDGERTRGLINVFSEVPYFNTNWRGDLIELKRVLEGAGFEVNILFGPQSAGVSEWKTIPKAQFNLLVSPWVGLSTVEYLKEKYGQDYLHIPILPIGEEATSGFLRQVVEFAGIDKEKSEKFIAKEADEYYYFLEHFSEFFSEYWYGLPSRFATVGDSAYNIAVTKFLADQIGLIPIKQIITDNPPQKYRAGIAKLYENLSEGISAEALFIEDGYEVEKEVENAPFCGSVPLIIGSSWEKDAAVKLGGLLIETTTPVTEELVINRSYIGYKGALSLLEKIYTLTVGGK